MRVSSSWNGLLDPVGRERADGSYMRFAFIHQVRELYAAAAEHERSGFWNSRRSG